MYRSETLALKSGWDYAVCVAISDDKEDCRRLEHCSVNQTSIKRAGCDSTQQESYRGALLLYKDGSASTRLRNLSRRKKKQWAHIALHNKTK